MSASRAIAAAALADFRQRVRSFRFLLLAIVVLTAAIYMVPPREAGYTVMQLGNARGSYGAAWIGFMFGTIGAAVLPLFGFYVIKDAIARDRETRVGLLLAASPLTRAQYVGAKFLSNVGVFLGILALAALVAHGMQVLRGEDTDLQPAILVGHLLAIALPSLLATAALAVLFEAIRPLAGAAGNVLFFVLWSTVMSHSVATSRGESGAIVSRHADLFGISAPLADFERRLDAAHPGHARTVAIGVNVGRRVEHVIAWPGLLHDGRWLAERLAWTLVALPLLGFAALAFDRFDPARGRARRAPDGAATASSEVPLAGAPAPSWQPLTRLPAQQLGWRPAALLVAELRLALARQPWWWYAGVLGFWIAGLAATTANGLRWVVPLAWFWALTRWSELGARATRHGMLPLLRSAPAPVLRQLPVQALAGVAMALLLALPVVGKLVLAGAIAAVPALLAGAAFLAAASLAAGALTGGTRLFEFGFLLLLYASLQDVPGTAFAGRLDAPAGDAAAIYALLAAGLFAVAAVLRGRSRHR